MPTASAQDWLTWHAAARGPMVDAALRSIYAELDAAVRARGPTCWQSGKCCHFDAYGHRLYVTGLEIAWLAARAAEDCGCEAAAIAQSARESAAAEPAACVGRDGCPFQVQRLCAVHAVRPLGCRVFFCQAGTQDWQQELYERFLEQLRRLHDQHGLAYAYLEWRQGLLDAWRHSQAG